MQDREQESADSTERGANDIHQTLANNHNLLIALGARGGAPPAFSMQVSPVHPRFPSRFSLKSPPNSNTLSFSVRKTSKSARHPIRRITKLAVLAATKISMRQVVQMPPTTIAEPKMTLTRATSR